jgi:hypothetical protein
MGSPILAFASGFVGILLLGALFRFIQGLSKELALKHHPEEGPIPITLEHRRSFSLRTLRDQRWRESVELTLLDDSGKSAVLSFSFHPWWHFRVERLAPQKTEAAAEVALSGRPLMPGKCVSIGRGDQLRVGERTFQVL